MDDPALSLYREESLEPDEESRRSDRSREEGEISDEDAALLEELIGESDRLDPPTENCEPPLPVTTQEPPRRVVEDELGYRFITEEKSECLVCKKKCCRKDALKRHWESKHTKEVMLFQCPECSREMLRKEDLIHHGSKVHKWSEEEKFKQRDIKRVMGKNKWYKSPKGRKGPPTIRSYGRKPAKPTTKPFIVLAIPSPIRCPTSSVSMVTPPPSLPSPVLNISSTVVKPATGETVQVLPQAEFSDSSTSSVSWSSIHIYS